MKILFVGNLHPAGRTFQRKRALEELGHDVLAYSYIREHEAIDGKPPLLDRIRYKLGLPPDPVGINEAIRAAAARERPDVLWIEKGNTVRPATLKAAKQTAPKMLLVSYTEDDMYARHNRSLYYTRGLRLYDCVFTTKSYNCNPDELPALGARRVVFVDKAYDIHQHRPLEVPPAEALELGADVGFIGTFERERAMSMLHLARNGIPVRIWGNDWARFRESHPKLRIEQRPLYGDAYVKAICATGINLCFLRAINRDLQTDRTMELPACGGFMLAERTPEHSRLFTEGREAAYFGDDAELLQQVRYYLEHDEARRAIAAAGRRRCLDSGYSHHDRLSFMLDALLAGNGG